MKPVYFWTAGLMALPIALCYPGAGSKMKREAEEDTPSIFGYLYDKRKAEEDTPSIFGYLYDKREAEEDTPSIFGYLYNKRNAHDELPPGFEHSTDKQ
jgi:hypothetical protein